MQRKKINWKREEYARSYSNWLAQVTCMCMPKNLYLVAGRGSSKTTEFQVERLMDIVYDMPGAPVCWVADTYANLQQNVLPMVLEGLERKGWREGIHFVVGKQPPEYTEQEKEDLPEWLRPHFWKPHNKIINYKHSLIFFTGLNITFGSLDRPSSLAGRSYVHIIGDEVKYFPETKIANLMKALRGYKEKYGRSTFYGGVTFTTDMPNISNIGEYRWIMNMSKAMNVTGISTLLKTAMVANECRQELYAAKERGTKKEIEQKQKILDRWEERLYLARLAPETHNFFYVASSYINVDVLSADWFRKAFETNFSDTKTAILSIPPTIEGGERFYAALTENHFYYDGNNEALTEHFGIRDYEDCRILKYLNPDKPIEAGMDFGNMMSMSVFQENININTIYFLKFLYTLSPEWIEHLAVKFLNYFAPHTNKLLILHYDRAGNNLRNAGQDMATKLKTCIETHQSGELKGKRTGWRVQLASLNQGNIGQQEEYHFMQTILGETNHRLPRVRIDAYNCKPLKCSLELARTKKIINARGDEYISKDKKSEKLPIDRLLYESTNPSDSLKYGLMTKQRRMILMRK